MRTLALVTHESEGPPFNRRRRTPCGFRKLWPLPRIARRLGEVKFQVPRPIGRAAQFKVPPAFEDAIENRLRQVGVMEDPPLRRDPPRIDRSRRVRIMSA